MTCSLFHCFDPYVVWNIFGLNVFDFPLKWFFLLLFFSMMSWQGLFFSGVELIKKNVIQLFWSSFRSLMKDLEKSFLILFPLTILILLVNVFGLVPFVFTFSSHLSFNLSFSVSLWMSGVFVSLINSIKGFFSHMVPTGTPMILWVFLVLVETVSQFIRPLTLSIRLMANVMAGHLIVNLFGSFVSGSSMNLSLIPLQSSFLFFEICVSIVQAYVFVSLLSLYWDEGK